MAKIKWVETDPDAKQFGRVINIKEGIFEFKEETDGEEIKEKIDLEEWKISEVEGFVNPYGYTLYQNKKGYQYLYDESLFSDPAWIIAECIFEMKYAKAKRV